MFGEKLRMMYNFRANNQFNENIFVQTKVKHGY